MSDAASVVKLARLQQRPTALYYIERVFDGFMEFHGDRLFADDRAVVGGIARLGGRPVTVVGIQKGTDLDDNILRNFGQPHPEGYRKALRLMRQAEKFGRPVVSLISTPGAYCGIGAEERGQGEAIARNLCEMSALRVPLLSVIIGEGGSGGALALACADSVWMLENSIYSVLSPEGFASILWKDASRSGEAAELMRLTSADLLELGVIERILPEPDGGADKNSEQMAETMKREITREINRLAAIDTDELLNARYERFRKFGDYS